MYIEEIKYTIYKLIDPISNDIRYIGLTFNSLKQRLSSQLYLYLDIHTDDPDHINQQKIKFLEDEISKKI